LFNNRQPGGGAAFAGGGAEIERFRAVQGKNAAHAFPEVVFRKEIRIELEFGKVDQGLVENIRTG